MNHPPLGEGLCSGYYKAVIHRAAAPDQDYQRCVDCLRVLCSARNPSSTWPVGSLICQVSHPGWHGNYPLRSDRPRLPNETFCSLPDSAPQESGVTSETRHDEEST